VELDGNVSFAALCFRSKDIYTINLQKFERMGNVDVDRIRNVGRPQISIESNVEAVHQVILHSVAADFRLPCCIHGCKLQDMTKTENIGRLSGSNCYVARKHYLQATKRFNTIT